jgi:hypothetical protein
MHFRNLPLFAMLLAAGCYSNPATTPVVGSLPASGRAPQVGQIDDDRDAVRDESLLATILLSPVRVVGQALEVPVRQIKKTNGQTPLQAARMTTDIQSADNRRVGLYRLVEYSFAQRPPYTTRYEQMAQSDPDPTVRAAAIRSCNRARDTRATAIFITALTDSNEMVRLEGAKGLANVPDAAASAPLLKLASDPDQNRDVRIAATDALKYYRAMDIGRALANLLGDRDFAVEWQARRSLCYMTHRDFRLDQGAWLNYIAGPDKPLE